MQSATRTGIGLFCAFVIGLVVGWGLAGVDGDARAEESAVARAPRSEPPRARPAASVELVTPTRVPEASPPAEGPPSEDDLPPIRRPVRREADLPDQDVAPDEVFTILAVLDASRMTSHDLVMDAGSFAALFPRSAPETVREGVRHVDLPDRGIEDGVTLDFPPGVFDLKRLMREKDPFPGDVTIQGAGVDLTLLLFAVSTGHRLRNFSVRDCTVFSNDYVFDLRSEPASIQLERVRVTGFDIGAGGSCMLASRATVFYARDCHFVGGYGRSPRNGRLFRVRGPLLARFENCRIETVNLDLHHLDAGSTVAFADCEMSNILDWDERFELRGALFPGTVVHGYDWTRGAPPKKDLNHLFPGWEERVDR